MSRPGACVYGSSMRLQLNVERDRALLLREDRARNLRQETVSFFD